MMVASMVVAGEIQRPLQARVGEEGYPGAEAFGGWAGQAVSGLFDDLRVRGEQEIEGRDEDGRQALFVQSLMAVFMASNGNDETTQDPQLALVAGRHFLSVALVMAPETRILGATSVPVLLPLFVEVEQAAGDADPAERAGVFLDGYLASFGDLPEGSEDVLDSLREHLGELLTESAVGQVASAATLSDEDLRKMPRKSKRKIIK